VSLPDHVAAYLKSRGNVSAAVVDAVERVMRDEDIQRQRRRAEARQYAAWLAAQPEVAADLDALAENSNRLSLTGQEW